jgi:hypothetical protein
VVAFNTAEHWAEDVSEDVAREIMHRLDLAGGALPSSLAAFVDSHLGPDRQLTLRLARADVVGSTVSRSDHVAGSKAALRDAVQYITKLPKVEHDADEWQAAMEALLFVAELDDHRCSRASVSCERSTGTLNACLPQNGKTSIGGSGN